MQTKILGAPLNPGEGKEMANLFREYLTANVPAHIADAIPLSVSFSVRELIDFLTSVEQAHTGKEMGISLIMGMNNRNTPNDYRNGRITILLAACEYEAANGQVTSMDSPTINASGTSSNVLDLAYDLGDLQP